MKIELKKLKIKDLIVGFVDNGDNGVYAFNGKLNIRPPYQREFIYDEKDRANVIDSIMNGFPLNTMYWCVTKNKTFEILDGQQRTLSICDYVKTNSWGFESKMFDKVLYYDRLPEDYKERFLNYELQIYVCDGTESEKLKWFEIINIAGKTLTPQELRNAIYSGPWTIAAKKYFSKINGPGDNLSNNYIKATINRQELLEKVLQWISDKENTDVNNYMSKHQNDADSKELENYFEDVINWVKKIFIKDRKEYMKHIEWGLFYNKYKEETKNWNPNEIEEKIKKLMQDNDVERKIGIYEYLFDKQEKHLNLRTFNDNQKRSAYEKQNGICANCKKHFEFEKMQADHIVPWSKGGKTIESNLQMLCEECNKSKSNK